jgi:hypothetical protein
MISYRKTKRDTLDEILSATGIERMRMTGEAAYKYLDE